MHSSGMEEDGVAMIDATGDERVESAVINCNRMSKCAKLLKLV